MAGDGFDVRPEVLQSVSTAIRDDAERVCLAATSAVNALSAAVAAAGKGPLGDTVDQVLGEVRRSLGAASEELAANADRVVASATGYQAGDTSAAESIRRTLSPDAASRS